MHDILSADQRTALTESVRKSYMEIFPTATIESKLDVLEPGAYVAVTCSPTKGIGETLAMSQRIARRGFRVVPHVAARMVRDKQHLREIVKRLDDTPIVSLFVPGRSSFYTQQRPVGTVTTKATLCGLYRDANVFRRRRNQHVAGRSETARRKPAYLPGNTGRL